MLLPAVLATAARAAGPDLCRIGDHANAGLGLAEIKPSSGIDLRKVEPPCPDDGCNSRIHLKKGEMVLITGQVSGAYACVSAAGRPATFGGYVNRRTSERACRTILHGVPEHVRSDSGPEIVAKAMQEWIGTVGAKIAYTAPGGPWENGFIESVNARLRDELPDGEIFYTLAEAKIVVESWRRHFNTLRPHGSLGWSGRSWESFPVSEIRPRPSAR